MSLRLLSTLGCALLFSLACGGGSTTAPPAPPAAPAPAPVPPPPAPVAASGDIGVPECDEYVKQMTACLGTMDPTVKAATESSFKQSIEAWRAAASTPQGKASLGPACKAALDAVAATCPAGGTATATAPAGGTATATAPAGGTATATAPAGGTATVTTPAAPAPAAPPTATTTTTTKTVTVEVTKPPAEEKDKAPSTSHKQGTGRKRPTH